MLKRSKLAGEALIHPVVPSTLLESGSCTVDWLIFIYAKLCDHVDGAGWISLNLGFMACIHYLPMSVVWKTRAEVTRSGVGDRLGA